MSLRRLFDVRSLMASRRPGLFTLRVGDFVRVLSASLGQAVCLVVFVLQLRDIFAALRPLETGVLATQGFHTALLRVGLLVAIAVLLGIFRAWEFSAAELAGYEVVRRVRMDMYEHLQRMLPQHVQHRARGGLLLRLTGDLSMMRMWQSRGVLEGMSAALVLSAGIGVLVWFSPWLALAAVTVYLLGAVVSLFNGRAMREATRSMRRRRSLLIGNVDEQIASLSVTQVHGRQAGEYARLSRQNDSLTRALVRVAILRGRLRGLSAGTSMLASAAVLGVGLIEAQRAHVTTETVIAASVVARLLSRHVRTLGLMHDYWHRGLVSKGKIEDFMNSRALPPEVEALPPMKVRRGRVTFYGACVAGRLGPFDATVEPGSIVALVGSPGSGAGVIIDLLSRQVDLNEGQLLVDDMDISQTRPSSMARHIGIVSPNVPLMRGSIQRNLTYGSRSASPEEIQRVALATGVDDLLHRVGPEGAKFWLTERGQNLDPGDRQRIAIARALTGNPPILLLDDPLSGLAADERVAAREAIARHRGTVFWASPQPDDVALADEVWVFNGGRVVERLTGAEYADREWLKGRGAVSWLPKSVN